MTGEQLYEGLARRSWQTFPEDGLDARIGWPAIAPHQQSAFVSVVGATLAELVFNEICTLLLTHNLWLVQLKIIPWAHQDAIRKDVFHRVANLLNMLPSNKVPPNIMSQTATAQPQTTVQPQTAVKEMESIKEQLNAASSDQRREIYEWLYTAHNCRRYA